MKRQLINAHNRGIIAKLSLLLFQIGPRKTTIKVHHFALHLLEFYDLFS